MSGGVIGNQTNINSDQYFFVLANGQQINVSTIIATNGNFSTIKGDTATISSIISQNISTINLLADTAFISSLQTVNLSTVNLEVSTINNIGLSSFNLANWSQYKATNNIVGNSSNLSNVFNQPSGIYVPVVDISTINNATIANLQVKKYRNNTDNTNPTFYGGYINADNGISANSFSGNSASITAIGCVSLDAGNEFTNIGVISAYGVNRPIGFNALYVQGGITLDGGGTIHGITIGTQPVSGINTMRIDVLPAGIDIAAATYVTIDAGGAGNFACGGALSLAGGSYIELNTANINCIDSTYPGSCVLNVDNIFPSQNGRGNLNSFDLYNCVAPNFFNASNIITHQLSSDNINTSSITTTVEFINNTIPISNTYSNYNYGNNPIIPSLPPINLLTFIYDLSSNNPFAGYNTSGVYLIDEYNVSFTDSNSALAIIPNTLTSGICLSNQVVSANFGSPIGDILTFQFNLIGVTLPITYIINNENSDINIYIPAGDFEVAPYTNKTLTIDTFSNYTVSPASITKTLSSIYTNLTYFTQNISSTVLNIDISGYDTNNSNFNILGSFQLNASSFITNSIYTNTISAGNIIGNISGSNWSLYPAISNVNLANNNIYGGNSITTSNISTINISTGVIYSQEIYTQAIGQPNPFSNVSILVNNGFNMGQNNISNVNNFTTSNISTNRISTGSLYANSISTNTLTVINLENVSSISTNKLSVSYIENLSSLVANNVQASQLSSQTLYTSTGFFATYVSTQTANINFANIYQLSNNTDTRIRLAQSLLPTGSNTISLGTTTSFFNTTYTNNIVSISNITSTISVSSIGSINTNNIINIGGNLIGNNGFSTTTISSASLFVSSIQVNNISAGNIVGSINQSNITSSLTGLGTLGYISSSQLTSTVRGLGQIYLSSVQGSIQTDITSTITGLGTLGYISSSQLTSTVKGLGSAGYISTPSLTSTIVGWAGIPANKNVNLYGNNIYNINQLNVDTISPAHNDFVLFDGNGIQTNNITSADFTQINFNNDINLEQRYNIKDALSLTLSDGTNTTILSNDSDGFHLSNTANTFILQGNVLVDTISPYSLDYIQFPNGFQVDNIYSLDTEINFNNNVFFGGWDLSGAKSFAFLGTKPIITSGLLGDTNDIIVQNSIDMSNNSIINLFAVATDYISANSNPSITFSSALDLNYNNISNVLNVNTYNAVIQNDFQVDSITPYVNSAVAFPGFGIQTDYINADINTSIQFTNNSIDMNVNSISNVANLIIYDSGGNSYITNDIMGYLTLSNDFNTINLNANIFLGGDINLNYNNILNVNGLTLDNIYANTGADVYFNNNVNFNNYGIDNCQAIRVDYIHANLNGTPVFPDGLQVDTIGAYVEGEVAINTNLTLSNNNIFNVNSYTGSNISTINISTGVIYSQEIYTQAIGQPNPFSNVSILVNNGFNMGQNNISNANTLTTSNISTTQISTSIITTSAIYTRNLGNNNPYAVESIIVNNDFDMGHNNISNANTLTTSNISTCYLSTACLYTSSLTVSTINNSAFPLIQFGSGTNNNTITLPKHYGNTNYQILLTQRGASAVIPLYSSNITPSNFYVGGSAGSYQFSWMTMGF